MQIKKLMFVTKFDQLGFDALESLLNLRKAALRHVVFLNVIEREKVSMQRGRGYQKGEEIRLREAANIRFIDWAENLFETGMEVGVYIVVGKLVPQVIEAARKERADLIVIGRSHKGVVEQLYSGSDITELLHRAATPVLVYKSSASGVQQQTLPFSRPMLAVDWAPASLRAVEYLKEIGPAIEQVSLIHVASEKELTGGSAMAIQKTRKTYRTKLEALCDQLSAVGIDARAHVYIGDTEEMIETAARECKATMIIMGSSGKPAWAERWLGSTPRLIAEKSAFPTLLIPLPKTTDA